MSPLRAVAIGRCYRRDTVDATHAAVFHQIEFFAVDTEYHLHRPAGYDQSVSRSLYGEIPVRFRPSFSRLLSRLQK
jgi:phenylalanyl-tRNA synthetase alpha chain